MHSFGRRGPGAAAIRAAWGLPSTARPPPGLEAEGYAHPYLPLLQPRLLPPAPPSFTSSVFFPETHPRPPLPGCVCHLRPAAVRARRAHSAQRGALMAGPGQFPGSLAPRLALGTRPVLPLISLSQALPVTRCLVSSARRAGGPPRARGRDGSGEGGERGQRWVSLRCPLSHRAWGRTLGGRGGAGGVPGRGALWERTCGCAGAGGSAKACGWGRALLPLPFSRPFPSAPLSRGHSQCWTLSSEPC